MKFTLSKQVKRALNSGQPVLALESTIISSGMPFPQNIEFQQKAEKICFDLGVIPATIAIIKGEILIGLKKDELKFIATNNSVKKISKRIDPSTVGASKRSIIAIDNDNNIYIVKNIKSRIIMKDGLKLLDLAKN